MRIRALAVALALVAAAGGAARADQLADAFARARRLNRAVVVEFRADWCGPCRVFEDRVLAQPSVQKALRQRVFVQIDIDQPHGAMVAARHRVSIIPAFLSFDPSGRLIQRSIGLLDVATPALFLAFFDRAEVGREYRGRAGDPRVIRFAAAQAAEVRRAPGTAGAGWALARALMAGELPAADASALIQLHAASTGDQRLLSFTIYAVLAAGRPDDAFQVAERLIERDRLDAAALAAIGHADADVGRLAEAFQVLVRCRDQAEERRQHAACLSLAHRLMVGLQPTVIERIRHAVRLRALAALGQRHPGARAAELAAEDAAWGILPQPIRARAALETMAPPHRRWLDRGINHGLLGFRADGGLSGDGRFQLDGRALVALRSGFDVKPMALATAGIGIDFSDQLVYQAAAQAGFAVGGGVLGIYSGISAFDHGAGIGPALGVPIELAVSFPAPRFGIEASVRSTIVVAGDQILRDGSENAPMATDLLSLSLAARLDALTGPILVGVRHDQLLDRTLTGIWLGVQLRP